MIRYFLIAALFSLALAAKAQDQLALPSIVNYRSQDYKAGLQNWWIKQGDNGILYFGNNEGLLTFDGKFWKHYQLPNQTVIRSLDFDSKGRIYVGGQDEIGYFFPDQNGVLRYHSKTDLIPANERKFADMWNTEMLNDEVFFRSAEKIIHLKDGIIKVYKPQETWRFMGKANNHLYAQAQNQGFLRYDNGVWKPYCKDPVLNIAIVTSIQEYSGDTLLVTTLKHGIYLMNNGKLVKQKTSLDNVFASDRIFRSIRVNKDWFAFGTTSAGLLITDKNWNLIQKYSYQEGLQKNNIRSVFIDHNKNLWLGLDDGIDFIAINSAVKHIYPDKNKQVTSYTTNLFKNTLYIGTSNGLYTSSISRNVKDLSLSKAAFSEVKNTRGQVWNLEEINDQLLLGHEDGTFLVNGNVANQLYAAGTWLYKPVSNIFPTPITIAGSYRGLEHIRFSNDKFTDAVRISGISESLRFLSLENNIVWSSHPYRGIYRIELSPDFKKVVRSTIYSSKDGLPSDIYNYIYKVKNRTVVATTNGIYEYDAKTNRFKESVLLNPIFKGIRVQYLKEDPDGNIWFVTNKDLGVVDFSKPSPGRNFSVIYLPEIKDKMVYGFENIYPLDNENIFIGASKGVFHINYNKYSRFIGKPDVLINEVTVFGQKDSTIFGGYFLKDDIVAFKQDTKSILKLPHSLNSVHFEYSSTMFQQLDNVEFSYQLVGFDKDWSLWNTKTEKDYTNLGPGKYSFKVKARNAFTNESEPKIYTFYVLPAWYQSYGFYGLLLLTFCGIMFMFFERQQKKYNRRQDNLKYLHKLELEKSESEIIKLKNENLEADVNFKTQELATTAMHLVQRGLVLSKIKNELQSQDRDYNEKKESPNFKRILRILNEVEKNDSDWDHFSIHFDHVHSNFLSVLKERFPALTQNELKLCAYLKLNLTSKEMASLMSITTRAVEVGRYRLRKKLHLPPEVNLYDFFTQLISATNHKSTE